MKTRSEINTKDRSFPIIFIHYGDSEYLKYTLSCSKYFNENARVILLGDSQNKHYSSLGIEHFFFSDYEKSSDIHTFCCAYKHIAGKDHGRSFWTKFVFKRWFHIYEFLEREEIDSFWTFDSDNLILTDLSQQVDKFETYDCTEQCNGMCMNGFIRRRSTVKGYIGCINELFKDSEYLSHQLKSFEDRPDYAFTEMRAYMEYRKRSGIKTIRLNSTLKGESFDDCLCQSHGMHYKKGRKELVYRENGIYEKALVDDSLVKMNSLNMSWLPISLVEEVACFSMAKKEDRAFFGWHFFVRCKLKIKYWLLYRLLNVTSTLKTI